MRADHDRLTGVVEKMNLEGAPMSERLAGQEAENSLLLLGRIEQIAAILIADAIFVAGFEAEEPAISNTCCTYIWRCSAKIGNISFGPLPQPPTPFRRDCQG
jgi:hypothetical protein